MHRSRIAKSIIVACIVAVTAFSVYTALHNRQPSEGLPYEKISMEQAREYMQYEENYVLVDIGTQEEYRLSHIQGAISLPYERIVEEAPEILPDKKAMIYVYGRDEQTCDKAAMKLTNMGYSSITDIGVMSQWQGDLYTNDETSAIIQGTEAGDE